MSEATEPPVLDGEVIQFPGPPPKPEPAPAAPVRTSREVPGELRQIIPGHLKTIAGIRQAASWHYRRARHHVLFHLVRAPKRLLLTVLWAVAGVARLAYAQLSWWWLAEQTYLRAEAIAANDPRTWQTLHKHAREVRLIRGLVLLAELAALGIAAGCVAAYAPWWSWPLLIAAVLPVLAWVGRPADKPILQSAVVPARFDPLSLEVIIRALGGLGIGEVNKALREDPEQAVHLIDPITRDGPGWLARLDLPFGVTAGEVSEKREKLASGLRRQLGCVWPETDHKRHPGALNLWVGDEDMTVAEQPAWPLAKRGAADIFAPVAFGTDPRGRVITVTLMFVSVIIGSVPRMGKTFLLRLLLLICALDVRAEIHAYDLKGTGDLSPVAPVAHRYRAGDEPEDIAYLLADFRSLQREYRRRTKVIRELPRDICPENKVTPELASKKSLGLHPIVVAVDECQVIFEHPQHGAELEDICTDLTKRGPALGIIIMLATQRPDAKSIPTGISANAVLRMCLKVMGQLENDMVLGTSQYKAGIRATMFSFDDKGVFYFAGEGQAPRIMRGQKFDGPAAEAVIARARIMRERAGRLTGYALGQDHDEEARSFAADVLLIFGEAKSLWSETIAGRLAGSIPGTYADITKDAVASQLRALGVKVTTVRESGKGGRSGCYRADVEAATEPAHA